MCNGEQYYSQTSCRSSFYYLYTSIKKRSQKITYLYEYQIFISMQLFQGTGIHSLVPVTVDLHGILNLP